MGKETEVVVDQQNPEDVDVDDIDVTVAVDDIDNNNNNNNNNNDDKKQKKKSRLMITKMILENFKSYAGIKEIGPFHKCFSAVVGPNGSGKSNVIDAQLFVFGKRAKKLRLNKVSELIHNSQNHPNLEYARVSVFFQDIIDIDPTTTTTDDMNDMDHNNNNNNTDDDDTHNYDEINKEDGYYVVPNTQLEVTRIAYRNNTSKYMCNGKNIGFTDLSKILRQRGVDLDNNRFLILQGEVEQIAMMKPKGMTEHEDGLLEYLEDIIGSNQYCSQIVELGQSVEKCNDARIEKLNRCKITESEMANLEGSKQEAVDYLNKENALRIQKNILYQICVSEAERNVVEMKDLHMTLGTKLTYEKKKLIDNENKLKESEKDFNDAKLEYDLLVKEVNKTKEDFTAFEKKDIKLQEDLKFKKQSLKKLKEMIKKEEVKKTKANDLLLEKESLIPDLEKQIVDFEQVKEKEKEILDKLYEENKEKTKELRDEMETKQTELTPLKEIVIEIKGKIAKSKTEIQLLKEKSENAKRQFQQASDALEKAKKTNEMNITNLSKDEERVTQLVDEETMLKKNLNQLMATEKQLNENMKSTALDAEEGRARMQDSKGNQNQVLKRIMEASTVADGELQGHQIYGRLGDLGGIDPTFDVAISTACGFLDHIVIQTSSAGQACVQFLRKHNLGRASFIILEELDYLTKHLSAPPRTPSGTDRLFDLITPREEHFRPAFYMALRDTIVAKDLDEAVRVAYVGDKCKYRCVTLDGQLIDSSGSMSGGGKNVRSGGMGAAPVGPSISQDEVNGLEEKANQADKELRQCRTNQKKIQEELKTISKEITKLNKTIPKLRVAINSSEKQFQDLETRMASVTSQAEMSSEDITKLKHLENDINKLTIDLEKASKNEQKLENVVNKLQREILDVGGVRLKRQKEKFDNAEMALDENQNTINSSKVEVKSAKKTLEKAEKALVSAIKEQEDLTVLYEKLKTERTQLEEDALIVAKAYEDAQNVLDEKQEELEKIQKAYDELKKQVNKIKQVEVDILNQLDDYEKVMTENKDKKAHWLKELKALRKLHQEEISSDFFKIIIEDDDHHTMVSSNKNKKNITSSSTIETDKNENEDEGEDEDENNENESNNTTTTTTTNLNAELSDLITEELIKHDKEDLKYAINIIEQERDRLKANINMTSITEYKQKQQEYKERIKELEEITETRNHTRRKHEELRRKRLDEFMEGFGHITLKLKEMYQMITLGGDAELELVDSLDPFSEGIVFSVRPPKKSWKNISNLSGGEKTLSSLALVFALHHYKPNPLYVMDEIDAALDFKNVSIVGNYIKERTRNAQFIIISLRNNMFELADRLVGIYKTQNATKSVTINPKKFIKQLEQQQEQLEQNQQQNQTTTKPTTTTSESFKRKTTTPLQDRTNELSSS